MTSPVSHHLGRSVALTPAVSNGHLVENLPGESLSGLYHLLFGKLDLHCGEDLSALVLLFRSLFVFLLLLNYLTLGGLCQVVILGGLCKGLCLSCFRK